MAHDARSSQPAKKSGKKSAKKSEDDKPRFPYKREYDLLTHEDFETFLRTDGYRNALDKNATVSEDAWGAKSERSHHYNSFADAIGVHNKFIEPKDMKDLKEIYGQHNYFRIDEEGVEAPKAGDVAIYALNSRSPLTAALVERVPKNTWFWGGKPDWTQPGASVRLKVSGKYIHVQPVSLGYEFGFQGTPYECDTWGIYAVFRHGGGDRPRESEPNPDNDWTRAADKAAKKAAATEFDLNKYLEHTTAKFEEQWREKRPWEQPPRIRGPKYTMQNQPYDVFAEAVGEMGRRFEPTDMTDLAKKYFAYGYRWINVFDNLKAEHPKEKDIIVWTWPHIESPPIWAIRIDNIQKAGVIANISNPTSSRNEVSWTLATGESDLGGARIRHNCYQLVSAAGLGRSSPYRHLKVTAIFRPSSHVQELVKKAEAKGRSRTHYFRPEEQGSGSAGGSGSGSHAEENLRAIESSHGRAAAERGDVPIVRVQKAASKPTTHQHRPAPGSDAEALLNALQKREADKTYWDGRLKEHENELIAANGGGEPSSSGGARKKKAADSGKNWDEWLNDEHERAGGSGLKADGPPSSPGSSHRREHRDHREHHRREGGEGGDAKARRRHEELVSGMPEPMSLPIREPAHEHRSRRPAPAADTLQVPEERAHRRSRGSHSSSTPSG